MAKNDQMPDTFISMMSESVEQASKAMNDYLQLMQKTLAPPSWPQTQLNDKLRAYAEQNVAAAFKYVDKLTRAKDFQELVHIQTEFVQAQMETLSKQAQDVGETVSKGTMDAFKGPGRSS